MAATDTLECPLEACSYNNPCLVLMYTSGCSTKYLPETRVEIRTNPCCCVQVKIEFHITLWHSNDTLLGANSAIRDELLAVIGEEVLFEVVGVDHSTEVTAAEVRPEGFALRLMCFNNFALWCNAVLLRLISSFGVCAL